MASIIKADTLQSTTANVFVLNSSGTEYARFDSSGVFQLANPSSFPAGTAALPSITATGDTNTGLYFPAADTIAFTEGGVESMRINSSGNMGIGVTPSDWGSGAGAIQTVNNAFFTGYGNSGYIGQNAYRDGSGIWRYQATNPAARYGVGQGDGSFEWSRASSGTAGDAITFTQSMTLSAAGLLTIASGQIKFPAAQNASADANTLDDYEEGTWTPTIGADSVDGTHTYSQQQGTYTKVGRLVTVQCVVVMASKGGTVAGNVQIIGLPFTTFSTMLAMGTVGYFANLTNNVVMLKAYINHSVARINISKMAAAGVNMTQMVAADLATATALYVSASYYTT